MHLCECTPGQYWEDGALGDVIQGATKRAEEQRDGKRGIGCFPKERGDIERAEGHPKRLRATIPKNKLGPFSKTQRIGRTRALTVPS